MPVLEKGLEIPGLFASDPTGLSKSHLARRPGGTVSEIFRNVFWRGSRRYFGGPMHFSLDPRVEIIAAAGCFA
jgi:hypothetical protein